MALADKMQPSTRQMKTSMEYLLIVYAVAFVIGPVLVDRIGFHLLSRHGRARARSRHGDMRDT